MAKQKQTDSVIRRFDMWLPVRLNNDELRERGDSLAHQRELAENHALDAAEAKTKLKKKGDNIEMEITRLASIVREKQEPRPVVVEVRLTKKPGWVEEVRIDTGEIIATRTGTSEELQTDMLEVPYDSIPPRGELAGA